MTTTLKHEFHRVPMASMGVRPNAKAKVVGVLLLLVALAAIYWVMLETGALTTVTNKAALSEWIDQLGYWGPVGIIGLMITAIVLSPIPSAPIAMVAGAVYGSLWGTVIVVIGAEAGALIAFAIARSLGYDVVHRWRRLRPVLNWLGKERSQSALMLVIFTSRLVPFISFDAVSYAAGLTPLAFWRFVVATLAGVIPTAYLITAFGGLLMASESGVVTILLVLVSGITLLPIVAKLLMASRGARKPPDMDNRDRHGGLKAPRLLTPHNRAVAQQGCQRPCRDNPPFKERVCLFAPPLMWVKVVDYLPTRKTF